MYSQKINIGTVDLQPKDQLGTVSRVILERLLRDGVECTLTFVSVVEPSLSGHGILESLAASMWCRRYSASCQAALCDSGSHATHSAECILAACWQPDFS